MKNQNTISTTILLACFAFLPQTRAACGSPDPGCPGGNLAEGTGALLSLTASGVNNTALGFLSLRSNTEGSFNTGVGAGTLLANTTGERNTGTGVAALLSNSTGSANTANGGLALLSNTEGAFNTAVGDRALVSHTTGDRNTAIGASALFNDTIGTDNTAIGAAALFNNSTGIQNTAMGSDALASNTTGSVNTAIGRFALFNNTTGAGNVAVGFQAGVGITTGSDNIHIGNGGLASDDKTIRIGRPGIGVRSFIAGIRGVTTGNVNAVPVLIDSDGQLGTTSSSRRFKNEIQPMDKASEAILALKPITFHYKSDPTRTPQFGLVAEEVAEINPDLVVSDENGEIYTVRYDAVNAMLLNEFLKEHRRNEQQQAIIMQLKSTDAKQEAIIAQQQKQIEALTVGLQKVSGELELTKPAPRTVLNDP